MDDKLKAFLAPLFWSTPEDDAKMMAFIDTLPASPCSSFGLSEDCGGGVTAPAAFSVTVQ
jgi:hypothetical protein